MSLSSSEPGSAQPAGEMPQCGRPPGSKPHFRTPGLPTNTPSLCAELTGSPIWKCFANWQPQEEGSGARAGEVRLRGGLSSPGPLVKTLSSFKSLV